MHILPAQRSGVLAGGNFIVDHVKMIDYYPGEEMLASISTQTSANGGGPYNILKDLAKMQAPFPLQATGLLGVDAAAQWIRQDCADHGIDASRFCVTTAAATSYTDAFTVESTGRRTFFHQAGTNGLLAPQHFEFATTQARIFYLGYLMLLDTLDTLHPDGTTPAATVLAAAQKAGLATIVDCVSKEHADYARIGAASLPYTDILMLNEVEAGRLTSRELSVQGNFQLAEATAAAHQLLDLGVQQAVVIHAINGAVAVEKSGKEYHQASLQVPSNVIKGATGAGDAFAAGFIYAWHEGQPMATALQWSVCAAACCLLHPTTSEGMQPLSACLALAEKWGYRNRPL